MKLNVPDSVIYGSSICTRPVKLHAEPCVMLMCTFYVFTGLQNVTNHTVCSRCNNAHTNVMILLRHPGQNWQGLRFCCWCVWSSSLLYNDVVILIDSRSSYTKINIIQSIEWDWRFKIKDSSSLLPADTKVEATQRICSETWSHLVGS